MLHGANLPAQNVCVESDGSPGCTGTDTNAGTPAVPAGDQANGAIESQSCAQPAPGAGPAPRNANNGFTAAKDDPCAGYKEPSSGATPYCYGGQNAAGGCTNRNDPSAPNYVPLRLYNALLYFKSGHLGAMDSSRTHGVATSDTNGCQAGTEWACPAGDDNAEGNSHPFRPDSDGGRGKVEPCPSNGSTGFTPNAGGNHGGSATPTNPSNVAANECDFTHALWNIDVYFSANGRPIEPGVRSFDVIDTEGSDAAFSQS
jgi:hypothetical protein